VLQCLMQCKKLHWAWSNLDLDLLEKNVHWHSALAVVFSASAYKLKFSWDLVAFTMSVSIRRGDSVVSGPVPSVCRPVPA